MCNNFKDYRKTFDEKRNKNRCQINELLTNIYKKYFIYTKMVHTATYVENNMGLEVEVTSCVKDKRKNVC